MGRKKILVNVTGEEKKALEEAMKELQEKRKRNGDPWPPKSPLRISKPELKKLYPGGGKTSIMFL